MTETTVTCPNCKLAFKLTETIAAPFVDQMRRQYEKDDAVRRAEVAKREEHLAAESARLTQEKATLTRERAQAAEQVAARVEAALAAARPALAQEAATRARQESARELDVANRTAADLKQQLSANDAKLAEAQKAQAAAERLKRELEEQKRELDLTVERRIQESLAPIEETARKRAVEQSELKLAEKEKLIADLTRQIDEAKRKADQGSQQMQGEVQELSLEQTLRAQFPADTIEEVGKGEHGGDLVQRITGAGGGPAGVILWESKRTRNWSDGWLAKLRDDARRAGADAAIIVSQKLPDDIKSFGFQDGVWICAWPLAVPVGHCLRSGIIQASLARKASEGQQTKMGLVYEYLTGATFKHRLEAIVEAYSTMQEDLDREMKAIQSQWAKRDKQIKLAIAAATGMYGDLQGIAGRTALEVEGLEFKALDG